MLTGKPFKNKQNNSNYSRTLFPHIFRSSFAALAMSCTRCKLAECFLSSLDFKSINALWLCVIKPLFMDLNSRSLVSLDAVKGPQAGTFTS